MLLDIKNVSLSFADRTLFQNVNLRVEEGDRIGLVGANGEGKSSLLNLLNGTISPTSGECSRRRDLQIGYLQQNSGLNSARTIQEELRSVFEPLLKAQQQLVELSQEIERYQTQQSKDSIYQTILEDYNKTMSYFEANEGYQIDVKIRTVLNGMGFGAFSLDTVCNTLSGGEKTRLALAKLLLQKPELLMLDEPTNHLDIETLRWLEEYLAQYQGSLIVVSHDRYFLDQVCNRIWGLFYGEITSYRGNYSKYQQLRKAQQEQRKKEYHQQCVQAEKLTDYIARNKVRATTAAMAKSREKALEKLQQKMQRPPSDPAAIRILFKYSEDPVKDILQIEQLPLFAGGTPDGEQLVPAFDFSLQRGEKIAIIGPNGAGKSTLLKTLAKEYPLPQGARIRWGIRTQVAYYSQDFSSLSEFKTVKQELWDHTPLSTETEVRSLLANYGFEGESVDKCVSMLSGGEKSRLKLAILALQKANVLLLDEPTNHLDLLSREALEEALLDYTGTLLIVSHDRYLLSRIPTRLVELSSSGLSWYDSYQEYLDKNLETPSSEQSSDTVSDPSHGAKEYYRTKQQRALDAANRKRLQKLEQQIPELEAELAGISERLVEVAADYTRYCELSQEYEEKQSLLEQSMQEWAELSETYATE